MPRFLINQYGRQDLVELDNDRHIQGEILWNEEKHGPLPESTIVGAMDLAISYYDEIDEYGDIIKKEFDRMLILNSEKKAQLDAKQALEDAEKIQKENKKKAKDNLLFKLKTEDLKLDEINSLLRAIYNND